MRTRGVGFEREQIVGGKSQLYAVGMQLLFVSTMVAGLGVHPSKQSVWQNNQSDKTAGTGWILKYKNCEHLVHIYAQSSPNPRISIKSHVVKLCTIMHDTKYSLPCPGPPKFPPSLSPPWLEEGLRWGCSKPTWPNQQPVWQQEIDYLHSKKGGERKTLVAAEIDHHMVTAGGLCGDCYWNLRPITKLWNDKKNTEGMKIRRNFSTSDLRQILLFSVTPQNLASHRPNWSCKACNSTFCWWFLFGNKRGGNVLHWSITCSCVISVNNHRRVWFDGLTRARRTDQ